MFKLSKKKSTFIQIGEKQGIDKRRLPQAGLANSHHGKLKALLDRFAMDLIGQIGESNKAADHLEAAALLMEKEWINFETHILC